MFLAFLIVALLVAAGLAVWILGKNELIHTISDETPAWFVAIRFKPDATQQTVQLPMGVRRKWSSRADFTFVGDGEGYWNRFMILAGAPRDAKLPVFLSGQIEDAYVARLKLQRPPVAILGVRRLLHDGVRDALGARFHQPGLGGHGMVGSRFARLVQKCFALLAQAVADLLPGRGRHHLDGDRESVHHVQHHHLVPPWPRHLRT